jgi:hypothetical protein
METRLHTSFPVMLGEMERFSKTHAGAVFSSRDDARQRLLGFYESTCSVLWQISLSDFRSSTSPDDGVSPRMVTSKGRHEIAVDYTEMSPPLYRRTRYEILSGEDVV